MALGKHLGGSELEAGKMPSSLWNNPDSPLLPLDRCRWQVEMVCGRVSLGSRKLGNFPAGSQHPGLSSDLSGMARWAADSPRSGRDHWSCLHTHPEPLRSASVMLSC